ncbi:tripartite-type tricarboxylate transporter receptor subunit TctC [Cupriavidus alkaliphilus]|uniref:Bug family tripartite tricarboxylate transporter substrate binding protein n=1 Tax=Cupriavidus alkaliphilus TaxID=942866 RepID=UPI000DE681A2|nr:tripartite tricarboxylate transporter substrate binding protein [Cupriavidus alkaliphilus]PVY80065.1 tripartite-type tricarboxylate transporter receptor subunit TctC [Cupriavidus alkaliphilus]
MRQQRPRRAAAAVASAAMSVLALSAGTALAAPAYPAKAVTMVVAYPPGGDTDAMARLYADKLSARLKQPVIVENRPGAGGVVGAAFVSRAPADGYTLLYTPNPFTLAPMVLKLAPSASYDPLHGFTPVIQTAVQAVLLVANPQAGVKSVSEMVAAARAGKALTYGSPGAGSPMHIAGEMLNRAAGVKIQHVPYKGVAPAVNDVVAGHVPFAYVTLGPVAQYLNTGRLIPLAITDARRSPLLPNVPTLAELGYKDVVVGAWHGVMAPKGTPPEVVRTLNQQLNEVLRLPEVADKMATFGATPVGGAPAALEKVNAADHERLGKVIRELAITAE